MIHTDILRRSLGVNIVGNKCSVVLWAPFSERVTLFNETTSTDIALDRDEFGYHTTLTDLIGVDDLYRFKVEGKLLPDPASLSQPFGVHESSQVLDIGNYPWTDNNWINPKLKDYIIYELHTGTFSEQGNFDGIENLLPYLNKLGITAIELMPVAQFPGSRNWGYDGVFPYAVQNSYGGAIALQRLVDACHQHGIAVILDVVYNHLGPEGNYFESYGPYFTEKYKTPWGKALNFDDAWCDPVRKYFIENALMWLRDFHIDALRLDAIHAIKDYSPNHIISELAEAVAAYNMATGSNKYLIAETDLNDVRIIKEKSEDGYGVDAQWCDEFHHALRVATGQERTGYYADFDGISDFATAYKNAYVFTGQYSAERHRNFGTNTNGIPSDRFIVFSQNHDQVGNRAQGERTAHLLNIEQQKLAATAVLTSPYIPLLFMGEEWAASTPFLYFVDHSDKELLNAIEEGRKNEFSFTGEEVLPVAHDKATFNQCILNWSEHEHGKHAEMLRFYKHLIALRKGHPVFSNSDRNDVQVTTDEGAGIIIVDRHLNDDYLCIVLNFSNQPKTVLLKNLDKSAAIILDSSAENYTNETFASDESSQISLQINSTSAIIISNRHVLP